MLPLMSRTSAEVLVDWSCSALCMLAESPSKSWARRQEVISRRTVVAAAIYHQYQPLTAAYLSGIDWKTVQGGPKWCGQSMRAFHSPWTSAFWSSPPIGRPHSHPAFFPGVYYEKEWVESDEHFGVGSIQSFSWMCTAYVWESCCVPPSLPRTHRSRSDVWFEFALLISVHVIPSQRYRDFPQTKFPWITSSISVAKVHV